MLITKGSNAVTIDLLAGIPNPIGNANVFVLGSTGTDIDLGIAVNGDESPPRIYTLGELIIIGKDTYQLLELTPISSEPAGSAPGTGSAQVVARIKRIS